MAVGTISRRASGLTVLVDPSGVHEYKIQSSYYAAVDGSVTTTDVKGEKFYEVGAADPNLAACGSFRKTRFRSETCQEVIRTR